MSQPIPFKRRVRLVDRRPLPIRVRHVDDGSRPVGRSRCFELDELALAELLDAATRMEARQ